MKILVTFFSLLFLDIPNTPPTIDMDEVDICVAEGEAITMVCRVGGRPEPRLVFYKDEKRLRPNENIFIGMMFFITVSFIDFSHLK